MRDASPYIAITALLITLGGSLYGWATMQGALQADVRQLRREVDTLHTTVRDLSANFQGTRVEITRWMALHEASALSTGR